MKKGALYLLLSIVILCTLVGCNSQEKGKPKDKPSESTIPTTSAVLSKPQRNTENTEKEQSVTNQPTEKPTQNQPEKSEMPSTHNVKKPTQVTNPKTEVETKSVTKPVTKPVPQATEVKNNMQNIEIIVNDKHFSATLYDNESAKALKAKLPMTIDMSELNGNEKYYYLSDNLPTDSYKPSVINNGDLMLYGNDCLVLFYDSFSTSYSYTPLGRVDNPDELASALGSDSVKVTFR